MNCSKVEVVTTSCVPDIPCGYPFSPGLKSHLYIKDKANNYKFISSFRGGIIDNSNNIELFEGEGYEVNFYSHFLLPNNQVPYPPSLVELKLKEESSEIYLNVSLGDLAESFIFRRIDFAINEEDESNMISIPISIKEICIEPNCCCNKIDIKYLKGKILDNCMFRFKDFTNHCYRNRKRLYEPLTVKTCKSHQCL